MKTRNQHTGPRLMTPCPIARQRRKTVARRALQGVGMTGGFRAVQQGVML